MPRYRVTLGFLKHTMGPTETYISPDVSLGSATNTVQQLINKRNAILFETVTWAGIRISQEGVKRRSVKYKPGSYFPFVEGTALTVPERGVKTASAIQARPDQTRACLQTRLVYDTDRRVIRYFNFPPDAITFDEPGGIHFGGDTDYAVKFDVFWKHVISAGWSLKARNYGAGFGEISIQDWVQSAVAPENLGIVVASAPAPGIVKNDKVQIKGVKRRGTDRASYNGTYIVHAVNTTLVPDSVVYYLKNTESGDPSSVRLNGTVQKIGHTYYPIQQAEAVGTGTHKRGNSFDTPSGRRVNRPSLGGLTRAAQ